MKLIFKKLLGGIIPKFNPGGQTQRLTKKTTSKRKLRLATTNSSISKPGTTYVERPNMFTNGTHREMILNYGIKNLDERNLKLREYDDKTSKLIQQRKYTEARRRDLPITYNRKELDRKKLREKDDWKKKHKGKTPLMSSLDEKEIKRRQQILADAGLYKGKIDGKWGDKSNAAQAEYDRLLLNKTLPNELKNTSDRNLFADTFSDHETVPEVTTLGGMFPQIRQVGLNIFKSYPILKALLPGPSMLFETSDRVQTNSDFSNNYLENLSQLGLVALKQYVDSHNGNYPKPNEVISLPLNPLVYKAINPSGKYADWKDIGGMINGALGGDRQVEYTDGGMSGNGYIDDNGNFHWHVTDNSSFAFDPRSKERHEIEMEKGLNLGNRIRYFMGNIDPNIKEHTKQDLDIVFPADISQISNTPRYSNVPKYKQK